MTQPRCNIAGSTYLLTRRSMERQFLFVPRGCIPEIFGYCLTVAARSHGIQVHAVAVLSNHWHAVVTDPEGRVSAFLRDFHAHTARAINRALGRHDSVWSGQRPSIVRLVGPETVMDKLVYTLTNVVAAGLVQSHSEWPGLHTAPTSVLRSPTIWRRPGVFFREDGCFPETIELAVAVPPDFAHLAPEEYARQLAARVQARETALRQTAQQEGRFFLGARRVLRQSCRARPSTPHETSRLRPEVACADSDRRVAELHALATFRNAYRAAREAWRQGDRAVVFPYGTLQLVEQHGVRCHPPPRKLRLAA